MKLARRHALHDGVDGGQNDERLGLVRRALRRARQGWRCAGRWSRRWAPPGRKARRPRRESSTPRYRARRSGAPLPAWRAWCRRARHAGSGRARRSRRRGGQARRAEARRAPRARRRRSRAALFSRRSTGKEGSLGEVDIDERVVVGQPVGVRPWKRLRRSISSSRSGSPSRIAFEHATFDRGIGRVDQALEHGNLGGVHPIEGLLGEAAEQEIHLLRAAMRRPPQRPAAAHAKITAGHEQLSCAAACGLERARAVCQGSGESRTVRRGSTSARSRKPMRPAG